MPDSIDRSNDDNSNAGLVPRASERNTTLSRRVLLQGGLSAAATLALSSRARAVGATQLTCAGQDACGHIIGGIKVAYRKALPVSDPQNHYPGFGRTTTIFKAGTSPVLLPGTTNVPGTKTLPVDIRLDRDVPVTLRDGVTIYIDVYRPANKTAYGDRLPAIVAWSPYGKEGGWQSFQGYNPGAPGAAIVPPSECSNLAKFEGPDPAFWCQYGYAIVNVDIRGVNSSEGDIHCWGKQDAQDGYDVIEWIAAQPYSTGAVGMSGCSWLAIDQWFIAAERPPHLLAINPREGFSDSYRDGDMRGGVQTFFFNNLITSHFYGNNNSEDMPTMGLTYPLMNPYWEDKSAKVENIDIPVFLIGSWTNTAHTMGTYTAWRSLRTPHKWLRVHNTQEWVDCYNPVHEQETRQFFDRYLKGLNNGWEQTPRVRLSVLNPGGTDLVNVKVSAFPLEETVYVKLFLDATNAQMERSLHAAPAQTSYHAGKARGSASFTYRFDRECVAPKHNRDGNFYFAGYFKLRLWLQLDGSNEADLFVLVQKLDRNGIQIPVTAPGGSTGIQPSGPVAFPNGILRASHRELDPSRSTVYHPVPDYYKQTFINPGEIVALEIPITPMAIHFAAGEYIRVVVQGNDFRPLPPLYSKTYDSGTHIIHTGGIYDSHLLVPYIPT